MPANKNAVIRYMYLDQLLSDRHNYYTRNDLCERVNRNLALLGLNEVSKRTIELDLIDMSSSPFNMDIDDSHMIDGKHIVRYADQTRSMFSKPISPDEKKLLAEVLNTLGQFSGLDNFEWLDDLQKKLGDKTSFGGEEYDVNGCNPTDRRKVIEFSSNPYLRNRNFLGGLFSAISNRKVLSIRYRKFNDSAESDVTVYPYLLKQYNNRWYLICTPLANGTYGYNPEFIMNLALDRITSFEIDRKHEYLDCPVDIEERYEEIVGVTYYDKAELNRIVFAVRGASAPYLDTKPVHGSQARLSETDQTRLHEEHPNLEGYVFYSIECRINWELESWLHSYADALVVISPEELKDRMVDRLNAQMDKYKGL